MAEELAYTIAWTEQAQCDLERIDRYLRRRSPAAADRVGHAILARTRTLAQFPELGPLRKPDAPWRFLVERPHLIFYRILPAQRTIEIGHVRHGMRDEPTEDDLAAG